MAITTWAATTGDWDDSKFSRSWAGPNIAPAVGSLSLSTTAPSLNIEYFISPAKGDIELIQSYEWDQMGAATWNDTTYSWDTGPSPNTNIGTVITPDNADLTITGNTPAQGIIYTFPVANADLTVTGQIPFAGIGTTISPDKGDVSVLTSFTWDNYGGTWATASTNWDTNVFAPDAVEAGLNEPAAGELTLTGFAPAQGIRYTFSVDKADVTVTAYAPGGGMSHFRNPAKADITGLAGTAGPWNESTETWATITGAWQLGELTPTAGVTYTFPIDEAETLTLESYLPVRVKKDPTYLADVIVT